MKLTVQDCARRIKMVRHTQKIEYETRSIDPEQLTKEQILARKIAEVLKDLAPKNKMTKRVKRRDLASILVNAAKIKGVKSQFSDDKIAKDEKNGLLPAPKKIIDANGKATFRGYDLNAVIDVLAAYNLIPELSDYEKLGLDIPTLNDIGPIILAIFILKGGAGKTTTSIHFAQYLAMKGHRVLVIDTDPQGSLTFQAGYTPDYDIHYKDTITPFLFDDEKTIEQTIAKIKLAHQKGSSIYSDEFIQRLAVDNIRYAIRKTSLKTLDIIPSCLQNDLLSSELPKLIEKGVMSESRIISKLKNAIRDLDEYDFVIMDGTPSLNASSTMYFMVSDMVISPIPARLPDFVSASQYLTMSTKIIESKAKQGIYNNFPIMTAFISRFGAQASHKHIENFSRCSFKHGVKLFNNTIGNYSAVDDAVALGYTVYEASASVVGSEPLNRAVQGYNDLFDEIFEYIKFHLIQGHPIEYAEPPEQEND